MTADKTSHRSTETKIENPLANIAGKFGGEFWQETQSEIEHFRQLDKEQTEKLQDNNSSKKD